MNFLKFVLKAFVEFLKKYKKNLSNKSNVKVTIRLIEDKYK